MPERKEAPEVTAAFDVALEQVRPDDPPYLHQARLIHLCVRTRAGGRHAFHHLERCLAALFGVCGHQRVDRGPFRQAPVIVKTARLVRTLEYLDKFAKTPNAVPTPDSLKTQAIEHALDVMAALFDRERTLREGFEEDVQKALERMEREE